MISIFLGTFKEGLHDGYVLKELCKHEQHCCELLRNDILKDFVPKYNGTVKDDGGKCKKNLNKIFYLSFFCFL